MSGQTITGILRYRVPDHQDHAVLRAALLREGYDPSSEMSQAEMFLLIPCTGDRAVERERVRTILQDVHATSLSGPDLIFTVVRFDDEPQDDRDAVDERPASAQGAGGRSSGKHPEAHSLRDLVRHPPLGRFRTRVVPAALGGVAIGAAGYAVTGPQRRRRGLVVAAGAAVVAAVAAALGGSD